MLRIALVSVVSVVSLFLAACGSGSQVSTQSSQATTATAAPRVRQPVEAHGKFSSSCDVSLGSDNYSLYASTKLHATGNVGIKVRVVAVFDQATSPTIIVRRVARIKAHASRSVKIRVPITQSQVEEYQGSPDYMGGDACRVHASIVSSFGTPPYE
jgi:hypothetical protein